MENQNLIWGRSIRQQVVSGFVGYLNFTDTVVNRNWEDAIHSTKQPNKNKFYGISTKLGYGSVQFTT